MGLLKRETDEVLEDFDSDLFLRKMTGRDVARIVTLDKKYKASQLSLMLKTMLISLEVLAERLTQDGIR